MRIFYIVTINKTQDTVMIIAFSPNTARIIPQIFCRHLRHCAPIIYVSPNRYVMYQFVRRGHIALIYLTPRAINLLRGVGWRFIRVQNLPAADFMRYAYKCKSCVALCKQAIGLYAPCIFTPLGLYRFLAQKSAPMARPTYE